MTQVSGDEARVQLREMIVEIRMLEDQIETPAQTRRRTFRIVRGTLINVAGFALAAPTGGWSVILCAVGFWEWADALGEDAQVMNRQLEIRRRVNELRRQLSSIKRDMETTKDG